MRISACEASACLRERLAAFDALGEPCVERRNSERSHKARAPRAATRYSSCAEHETGMRGR
eukprot:837283-Pleurochrysis_carterae.AAC.1